MAALQLFLSAVSAEFDSYRPALLQHLSSPGRSVVIQEGFVASGTPTLDKLAGYVEDCDLVVHLLGDLPGAPAPPASVQALLRRCPDLGDRFPVLQPCLQPGGPALSYTQWEAWLALYYGKRMLVAGPNAGAPRGARYTAPSATDRAAQDQHRTWLAALDCHAEIHFDSIERLAIALHQALAAVPTGPAKPCDLPPPAGHFVGRATALADLVQRLRAGQHAAVVGMAGYGKTALAAAALRQIVGNDGDRLASSPWPDGIVLLDLYVYQGQADAAWHALANRVRGAEFMNDRPGAARAAEALRDQRLLVVVEGAEQADGEAGRTALPDFQRPLGTRCRWLFLTRLDTQADPDERVLLREQLDDGDAGELLDHLTKDSLAAEVREEVLALLQGHPLALTWAGKLMARGDEEPRRLLSEWQAACLPPLSDPKQARHTLAWLFDRSVSRLDITGRAAIEVAGCLAPTPVPLAAFAAALGLNEPALHAALRGVVQHGLMHRGKGASGTSHWQFAHSLAYGHARARKGTPEQVAPALASWVLKELECALDPEGPSSNPAHTAALLEHATALLKGDAKQNLWSALFPPLLYKLHDPLVSLGWSAQIESALAAVEASFASMPDHLCSQPMIKRERGVLANRQADLLVARGDLAAAERLYRTAQLLAEQLAAEYPSNAGWQHDLSVNQNKLAGVLRAQGDLPGAERGYRAAMAIRKKLAEAKPDNVPTMRALSMSLDNIGEVLSAQGDMNGAAQVYREALAMRERLAQADPSNAEWQRDLSVSQDNIGRVLSAHGDLKGAELAYRAALAVAERSAQTNPWNVLSQRDLAHRQDSIGGVLMAQGDLAGAMQAYSAALDVRERYAQADSDNVHWQRDLSVSHNNIGRVLNARGDLIGAEGAYRKALAVAERLAQRDPSNTDWQRDLGVCREGIGDVLSALGNLTGAEQTYRDALTVREQLAAADSCNAEWQRDLSLALTRVAEVVAQRGPAAHALPLAQRSLAIDERLAALDPRNATWQNDVQVSRALVARLRGASA